MANAVSRKICMLTKRPLGRLLMDAGLISRESLDRALDEQVATGEYLGSILVRLGALSVEDLTAALSLQRDLASLDGASSLLACACHSLGELLVDSGRVSAEDMERAHGERERSGRELWDVLLDSGLITSAEKRILGELKRRNDTGSVSYRLKIGELLVAMGMLKPWELQGAIEKQKLAGGRLGEVMVDSGYVEPHQVEGAVALQRKLQVAALTALLSFAEADEAVFAAGGKNISSAPVMVSAYVLPRLELRVLRQVSEVTVTATDVERGYVDVRLASSIEVSANTSYLLNFESMGSPFEEARVEWEGQTIKLGVSGGVYVSEAGRSRRTYELNYRFTLSGDARPGTYAWPITVNITSL